MRGYNLRRRAVGRFGLQEGSRRAFTIIELLVGFAILAVLVTLLLSVFSNFSQVTTSANRQMEVDKQSRTIFDRMAFDIGSAINSGNVRMIFKKNEFLPGGAASNNDAFVLLADAKSPSPDGRLAKVGYAVGPYTDPTVTDMTVQTVLRYVQPFGWDDDTTTIEITDNKYAQPIAPGIIRFELSFVKDGQIVATPPAGDLTDFYEGLEAIICTVATVDENVLQKLTPSERTAMAGLLQDDPDGKPLQRWQAVNLSAFPKAAVPSLRFHQRYFQLK